MDRNDHLNNSDDALTESFLRRDQQAIEDLHARYGNYLLSVCMNVLGNREDSEECLNDAYMRAWNSIPPNRPADLKRYMSKLARAAAIDRLRYDGRSKRSPDEGIDPLDELGDIITDGRTAADEAETHELAKALDRFLSGCTKREQICFVKRYYFCEPVSQISGETGIPLSTLYDILHTLREKLRSALMKEGFI